MALIEPEGMFGGDRMALLSDTAKLHWPWFWCASNTVGRIELDYHKVMARAYRQFSTKPTEVEFWSLAAEFKNSFLLYIYEFDGQIWGQWDTSEKNLQRHKLAGDARSPAPTVRDFTEFKNKYIESKKNRSSDKLSIINNFGNRAETREEKPTCSTGLRGVGVGVGVGVGGGGGEERGGEVARTPTLIRPPSPDFHTRFESLYALHPVPGFKADGIHQYLEILSNSVNPEQASDAIDRSHLEWAAFWEASPAAFRPGIGMWFSDGYYLRKPKAREPTPPAKSIYVKDHPMTKEEMAEYGG